MIWFRNDLTVGRVVGFGGALDFTACFVCSSAYSFLAMSVCPGVHTNRSWDDVCEIPRVDVLFFIYGPLNAKIWVPNRNNDVQDTLNIAIHPDLIVDGHPILSTFQIFWNAFSLEPASFAAFSSISILAGDCASSKYDLHNELRTLALELKAVFLGEVD